MQTCCSVSRGDQRPKMKLHLETDNKTVVSMLREKEKNLAVVGPRVVSLVSRGEGNVG